MNADDFEEQLERDNLTIKEQISSLQLTIKKLKNDMLNSNQNKNKKIASSPAKKNYKEDNEYNSDNREQYNNILVDKNKNNNQINITKSEKENFKFSFNDTKKQEQKIKPEYGNMINNLKPKKNFYQENLQKIRKEKQLLAQMESFKSEMRPTSPIFSEEPTINLNKKANKNNNLLLQFNIDSISDSGEVDKIINQSKGKNKYNNSDLYNCKIKNSEMQKINKSKDNTIITNSTINDDSYIEKKLKKIEKKRNITPTKTKRPTHTLHNTSNIEIEFKSYINEINNLKSQIEKLQNENIKLRLSLKKEKIDNEKYRELSEEIIKHFQKSCKKKRNKK